MTEIAEAQRIRAALDQRWSPWRKLSVAIETLAAYVRVRWLLVRHDLRETVVVLHTEKTSDASGLSEQLVGIRLGRGVMRTLRVVPTDSRCLMRSLVLLKLLTRRGIDGQLVIGVRSGPPFEAHAWIETGGLPLLPDGGDRYERFLEL